MDQDNYEDSPWNFVESESVNQAIAESIGIPEKALAMNKSYCENGGTSLDMMSTFLSLKQEGNQIGIEEFLSQKSLDQFTNSHFSGESARFQKKLLSEVPAEKAQHLLAECFVLKGDLEKGSGVSTEEFAETLRMAWPHLHKESFVMIDALGELAGVATLIDEVDIPDVTCEGCHPFMQALYEYFDRLSEGLHLPLLESLERGVVLAKFEIGTSVHATSSENVYLMYLMESEIHKIAEDQKFKMTISHHTSPLMQKLAELLGCKRLLTNTPKYYVNEKGEKPFSHLSDLTLVTVDVKTY